jgi:hypothetical protein
MRPNISVLGFFFIYNVNIDIFILILCRFYVVFIFLTYWLLILYFFNVENVDFKEKTIWEKNNKRR